jgi:hypothetical protein
MIANPPRTSPLRTVFSRQESDAAIPGLGRFLSSRQARTSKKGRDAAQFGAPTPGCVFPSNHLKYNRYQMVVVSQTVIEHKLCIRFGDVIVLYHVISQIVMSLGIFE